MSIKKNNMLEKEEANDNLKYGENKRKKQEDMMVAGLTKKQKQVIKSKQKIATAVGEPINVSDLLNNPGFKALGDKKDPATKKEIEEFIDQI